MEISFVVPIFNEEENIPLLVEKMELAVKGKYSEYEFILVDDGSTDKSKEILEKLSKDKKYLKPIFFKKNCGQSAALSAGFKYSAEILSCQWMEICRQIQKIFLFLSHI